MARGVYARVQRAFHTRVPGSRLHARARRSTCSATSPPGVPPLALDRRAHAARRARGELLVPPPPRRLRVDRRARRRPARRRPGVRRGLRLRRPGPHAPPASSASTPTPRPTSTRACATARPTCASCATWSRRSSEPCDAVVFLQTIEHVHDPDGGARALQGACCRPAGRAYVSTPNVLTLAPEGAEKLGQPVARQASTAREEFRALCAAHFGSVELYGLFHARKLRAHELALRRGLGRGPRARCGSPSRSTTASRPRSRPRDFALRSDARPRPRAGLRRRAAERERHGRLALVLHSHMPYVEGFGTWPFGEEWLWEAIATSYLPLLDVLDGRRRRVTLSLTPVLCDQLEAPGAIERCRAFLRDVRPASHALDVEAADDPAVAAELERAAGDYARAPAASACRGGLLGALAPHAAWTSAATHARAAAAGHRRGRAPAAAHRDRGAPRALRRRLARRLLAARVRARAVAGRAARGGRACTRPASTSPTSSARRPAPPAPAGHRGRAAARARSTAWRSSSCGAPSGYPSHARLPRLPPPHRARPPPVGQRRRRLRPGPRGRAGRAPTRRDFVARVRRARARRRAVRLRAGHRAARALVARGPAVAGGAWSPRRARAGLELVHLDDALADADPAPAGAAGRARDDAGARRATCRRGRARTSPTSRGAARAAELDVLAAGAGGRRRARCASCSRCRAATGPSWSSRDTAGPYPRERFDGHAAALRAALARPRRASPRCATSRRGWRGRRCSSRSPGRRTRAERARWRNGSPSCRPRRRHLGNAIEAAVTMKHRRRLRRLGWERALEPPDDGLWAAGDPAPRAGLLARRPRRRRRRRCRPSPRRCRARALRPPDRLAPGAALRARPRRAGRRHRRAARRAGRTHRRARARVGRRAGAGLSPHAQGGARRPWTRSRAARASAARPTRASTRSTATTRRRSASTARSRSSTASTSPTTAATASTPARIRPAGGWAGTTSARGCAGPPWPTCTITSPARWNARHRGAPRAPGSARARRATARSRSCAPSPRTCTTSSRAATSASSRATCARCAARSG